MNGSEPYLGKFRGIVLNNNDPTFKGRLQLMVPDVTQLLPTTWAEACIPLAGPIGPSMGAYFLPPIGSGVWVEFEHGDINKPIWAGCRWGASTDIPPTAQIAPPGLPNIVFQTLGQNGLTISDTPGLGIVLKSRKGATIIVDDTGIIIQNGKGASIMMTGTTVTINGGAIVVT